MEVLLPVSTSILSRCPPERMTSTQGRPEHSSMGVVASLGSCAAAPMRPAHRSRTRTFKRWCIWLLFTRFSLGRIDERLVNRSVAAVLQAVIIVAAHALNHPQKDDIVRRTPPKPGARRTIPEIRSLAIGQGRLAWIKDHRAVESVAEAGPHYVLAGAKFPREQIRRQVIRGHQLDCGRTKNAFAIQFPAVAQHLGEPIVVLR